MRAESRFPFPTYRHLLTALRKAGVTLFPAVTADISAGLGRDRTAGVPPPRLERDHAVRVFGMLAKVIRRSAVIACHIDALPIPAEQRDGRIEQGLELVFSVFREHKVDIATYYGWVDDELRRELDADMADDAWNDDLDEREPDLDPDVAGQRPVILVAELLCEFGVAVHQLPPEWLEAIPADLRLLCARAAAACIRPSGTGGNRAQRRAQRRLQLRAGGRAPLGKTH